MANWATLETVCYEDLFSSKGEWPSSLSFSLDSSRPGLFRGLTLKANSRLRDQNHKLHIYSWISDRNQIQYRYLIVNINKISLFYFDQKSTFGFKLVMDLTRTLWKHSNIEHKDLFYEWLKKPRYLHSKLETHLVFLKSYARKTVT